MGRCPHRCKIGQVAPLDTELGLQPNQRISAGLQQFFAAHTNRLTMFQLPTYSPDFNPIEFLWKKVKKQATHLRYFPDFDQLVEKVESALLHFASTPKEITALMGRYCTSLGTITE